MNFRTHLLLRFGVSLTLLLLVYVGINAWLTQRSLQRNIESNLAGMTQLVTEVSRTAYASYVDRMDAGVAIARQMIGGTVEVDPATTVPFEIVDINNGQRTPLALPAMFLYRNGKQELLTGNAAVLSAFIEVYAGTAAIFQVTEQGLLSIATNVLLEDGSLAIGTVMPPSSAIYQSIAHGRGYRGRALVLNNWNITAYDPLFDPEGKVIGALFVGMPQNQMVHLSAALERSPAVDGFTTFIIDREGNFIGHPVFGAGSLNVLNNHYLNDAMRDALGKIDAGILSGQITYRMAVSEGAPLSERMTYFNYLPELDWIVATAIDYSSARADIRKDMLGSFLFGGLLLAGLLVVLLFMSDAVSRPINRLSTIVGEISRKNFAVEVPQERGPEEVRKLYAAIREMAKDISNSYSQLSEEKARAEKATLAKSAFLSSMSHEIRTPMNAVIGMTALLSSTELSEEQCGYVDVIGSSGDYLLSLINDILDYSKIESGRLELDETPFRLAISVQSSIGLFLHKAKQKGVGLRAWLSPDLEDTYIGDVTRIRQVILNLLSNALKFTDEGDVEVRVELGRVLKDGRHEICIDIIDTGIGIREDERDRLFRPFSQADTSTTRKFGGTGLGLVICQHLAEAMGGTIDYESEWGKGTVFHFRAVLKPAADEQLESARLTDESTGFDPEMAKRIPLRILVVEDNQVNRKVIQHVLRKFGYTADIAVNGQEAVQAYEQGGYDLVLMDLQMPVMNGYEATKRIRELEKSGKRAYIAALTAAVLTEERESAIAQGMDNFLGKPVRIEEISMVLERAYRKAARPTG